MSDVSHDSETLAEGQQVITAVAFIHKQIDGAEKVFLPRRAATKKFLPNVFELPGGHIDYGEDLVSGLKREIGEEFGLQVNVGDPFAAFTYVNNIKGSHSVEIIYFAQFTSPILDIQLHPEDHSEYVWVSEIELPQIYTTEKGEDDIEFQMLRKGFGLLKGDNLTF